MKLFISWSGDTSRQIAERLHEWVPLVLPAVKPFITSADIDKGAKWQNEIAKELELSNFGVVCLTKDNKNSQWLAFEAGALSKHLADRVSTILFGLEHAEVSAPLSIFQNTKFDENDFQKLILSMDRSVEADQRRGNAQLGKIFPRHWKDIEEEVSLILKSTSMEPDGSPAIQAPAIDLSAVTQEILAQLRQQNTLLSAPERWVEPIVRRVIENREEQSRHLSLDDLGQTGLLADLVRNPDAARINAETRLLKSAQEQRARLRMARRNLRDLADEKLNSEDDD